MLYVYGFPTTSPSVAQLSQTMIDYWVSFATSLDPNDGRGSEREPSTFSLASFYSGDDLNLRSNLGRFHSEEPGLCCFFYVAVMY